MITQLPRRSSAFRSVAALSALGMLAVLAACGDEDGDDSGGGDSSNYSVEVFQANIDAFDALQGGQVDAVALTSFTVEYETDQMDGFEATEGFFPVVDGEEQVGCGGFGFSYDDVALRNAFNAELADMQAAGEVLPIVEPWGFNEEAVTEAADHTAAEFAGSAYDDVPDDFEEADLESYRQDGITIGIAAEPPYGFEEEGEAAGAMPELAQEIFDRLGIEVNNYEATDFNGLIGSLQAGRMDVISAGMFINEERAENVLFANPDYCATTAFAVPEGNPEGITDFDSAAEAGITLGVVQGTVEQGYAEALEG